LGTIAIVALLKVQPASFSWKIHELVGIETLFGHVEQPNASSDRPVIPTGREITQAEIVVDWLAWQE
jgi:hypothetical protein